MSEATPVFDALVAERRLAVRLRSREARRAITRVVDEERAKPMTGEEVEATCAPLSARLRAALKVRLGR